MELSINSSLASAHSLPDGMSPLCRATLMARFAWDQRGHGRSPGPRGAAENFAVTIKDVEAFVRHVSARHEVASEDIIALGHSMGAVSVAAWVHDYAPPIRAMVLATAAFRV